MRFFFTTHILAIEALRYFYDRGIDINDGNWGAGLHALRTRSSAYWLPKMNIAHFPIEEIGSNAADTPEPNPPVQRSRKRANTYLNRRCPLPDGIQGLNGTPRPSPPRNCGDGRPVRRTKSEKPHPARLFRIFSYLCPQGFGTGIARTRPMKRESGENPEQYLLL